MIFLLQFLSPEVQKKFHWGEAKVLAGPCFLQRLRAAFVSLCSVISSTESLGQGLVPPPSKPVAQPLTSATVLPSICVQVPFCLPLKWDLVIM